MVTDESLVGDMLCVVDNETALHELEVANEIIGLDMSKHDYIKHVVLFLAKKDRVPCCVCGALNSLIVNQYREGRWTVYCNSCGNNKSEALGDTYIEAMGKWLENTMKENNNE